MAHLISLSTQTIDQGAPIFPVRLNQELSEIADGVVKSFSNAIALTTEEGLIVSDTSGARTSGEVVQRLRGWGQDTSHTILYTHGHLDHVGGVAAFAASARELGHRAQRFVGHENRRAHGARADIYARRRDRGGSLMSRGIFGAAASSSREKA